MKAKLIGVFIDESTLVKDDKQNVTKRLVYDLGDDKFAVVKTFSSEKQDEDFGSMYRSVKIWKNAKVEDVSSHWNTKKVENVREYLTAEMMQLNVDTLAEMVDLKEVDTSYSGYMIRLNKKEN